MTEIDLLKLELQIEIKVLREAVQSQQRCIEKLLEIAECQQKSIYAVAGMENKPILEVVK